MSDDRSGSQVQAKPPKSRHVRAAGPRIPAVFWWVVGLGVLFLGGVAIMLGRLLSARTRKTEEQG